jgi:L-ascorbate metabolism protein UlaG (beta-lactamase superfamily)
LHAAGDYFTVGASVKQQVWRQLKSVAQCLYVEYAMVFQLLWRNKLRTGVGIAVVYTAYSTYVQLRTSYEITERMRRSIAAAELDKPSPKAQNHEKQFGSMLVGVQYVNPFNEYRPQTVFEFIYCRIIELFHTQPRGGVPSDPAAIRRLLPTKEPDFELLRQTRNAFLSDGGDDDSFLIRTGSDGILTTALRGFKGLKDLPPVNQRMTLTWLGQSCAYVQLPGICMLTDPCLKDHLVNEYIGPRRITPAPCDIQDLPPIDVVLVSHDHPDHLEIDTAVKIGNTALWVVPVGVGQHLRKKGIDNIVELDWWQRAPLPSRDPDGGWEVACAPAMHWSGRKMVDSNHTLWASFMVLRHGKPVFYHAGDTGYSPDLFMAIRNAFGPGCQVAMLPCGSYTPRWHLRPQHIDPLEAMQVMRDIGAHKMVGVHWGTFVMSDEYFLEPREHLHALAKHNHMENDVIAPPFGQTLVFRLNHGLSGTANRRQELREGFALLMD